MRLFVGIWAALVVLATATLVTSFFLHGPASLVAGMSFAAAKAVLVAWFFMHLFREGGSSRLAFLLGAAFVVLLVSFALGDVLLRPHVPRLCPVAPCRPPEP